MNTIIQENGLIHFLLRNGATIAALEVPNLYEYQLASMNPSIWINEDGSAYVNIRVVNYNLWNMYSREFTQTDQPIAYVNLIADKLVTNNYFGTFDINTLTVNNLSEVKMMEYEPKWYFEGLEDARIVNWNNQLHLCGVRRDLDDMGTGRMELSEITLIDNVWTEIKRTRIPAAGDDSAYLEKNWMPIIDKPYTWIKWCSPIEVAHYDLESKQLDIQFTNDTNCYFRGDSHLIHVNDKYYCFVHLAYNKQLRPEDNARLSEYNHYLLEFDENLCVSRISPGFKYDNKMSIEFGCGLAYYDGYCYLTYAENDAASFIIKFDVKLLEEIL